MSKVPPCPNDNLSVITAMMLAGQELQRRLLETESALRKVDALLNIPLPQRARKDTLLSAIKMAREEIKASTIHDGEEQGVPCQRKINNGSYNRTIIMRGRGAR